MPPILEQFDSNDAALLMYLAGELSPADRAAVQQRLATDEQLRSELEVLRASQVRIAQMLDALDASQPVPGSAASGERQIGRMMKQWQTEQFLRNNQQCLMPAAQTKWIWIGSAVAAMLLISWGVWWGIQPDKYSPIPDASADASIVPFGDLVVDDNPSDGSDDIDIPFEQSQEYAAMDTNVDYVNALSELTTLTLPPLQ